jgi:uncharacterized protein (TIRG00374 family)
MNKNIKDRIITLIKFLFAGGIIYYMISTGKLDLNEIAKMTDKPWMIVKAIFTLLGVYALVTIRWYYLLLWQGIPVTFRAIARINCIGLFFNSFMPGAVGGDLVKAFYVSKENKEHRTRAIVTILIDRIIGFETLMIVAFVAMLINYKTIMSNIELRSIALSIFVYIIISFIAAAAVFSRTAKNLLVKIGVRKIVYMLPLKDTLLRIYHAFHIYAHQKKRIAIAMGITIPLDILNIYLFFAIGREMGETSVSLYSYFTLVPVGLLMLSLPIAPAGVGVGQAAFNWLLPVFGAVSKTIGSTIITIYQLLSIALNMCFVTIYLGNKEEVSKAMKEAKAEQV